MYYVTISVYIYIYIYIYICPQAFGISEALLGFTVAAAGTSFPNVISVRPPSISKDFLLV